MVSTSHIPHPLLRPYIGAIVHSTLVADNRLMEVDLFPVGHSVMSFILDEEYYLHNSFKQKQYNIRFSFTGQLDRHHQLITSSASMVYVLFKPFGAYRLLGIPQHLLTNESIAVSDLVQAGMGDLLARMEDNAHAPDRIVQLIESWLMLQWERHSKLSTDKVALACANVMEHQGIMSIKSLCAQSNMSKSSLEQYFNVQVGLSPKMYSRVVRFNKIQQFLLATSSKDWQELAFRYNYFDQPHFIHDFKHFFGYTPSQMHLSYNNLANHLSSINK